MSRRLWIIATAISSAMSVTSLEGSSAAGREPVTSVAVVRGMSDDEVCSRVPVRLRGVATWLQRSPDGTVHDLIVQEGEAGLWVSPQLARNVGAWRGDDTALESLARGMRVEIDGTTVGGGFSPMVEPAVVRVLGPGELPAARSVSMDRFFAGAEDSLRVEVTGVVQWFADTVSWELTLEHAGRRFVAAVPRATSADPAATLVDARVRLRGVAVSGFNTRGEIMYPRLFVDDPDDVIVESPPRSPPFAAPRLPLRAIAHFRPEPLDGHRLRTEGVVSFADGHGVIFVQDGLTGVRVETAEATGVRPGDRIEIAGFLDRRRPAAGIVGGLVRVIASGPSPAAVPISPPDVIDAVRGLHRRGIMSRPGDYDGCLVEFPARLIDVDRTESGGRYTVAVEDLDSPVSVVLDAATFLKRRSLEPGSDLLLRGILQLEHSVVQRAGFIPPIDKVSLLVRDPTDVTVIRGPAWWNARRLAAAAGMLTAILLGALAWVLLLRRQVARQAARIGAEMRQRRDAAVEFEAALRERGRLAANLHDTLLQALAGAVLQIDLSRKSLAARQIDKAGDQLDVAKRMVKHSVADLRSSVWSLRTAPQAGRTFSESLRTMLDQFRDDDARQVTLDISGAPLELPTFVSGNLLLVVQEAVRNAIHHGRAANVRVGVRHARSSRGVEISIADDGDGFDPATMLGPDQGHFGLQVMRERIEGLEGTFSVETREGVGTTITISVPAGRYASPVSGPSPQ